MPRELTEPEILDFLERHGDVWRMKTLIDNGSSPTAAVPLAFPYHGLAVREDSGDYVLVWRDASERWHFIDLSDDPAVGEEIGKPEFFSPDSSFLDNVLSELRNIGGLMVLAVAVGLLMRARG